MISLVLLDQGVGGGLAGNVSENHDIRLQIRYEDCPDVRFLTFNYLFNNQRCRLTRGTANPMIEALWIVAAGKLVAQSGISYPCTLRSIKKRLLNALNQ